MNAGYNKKRMIGSLGQFLPLERNSILVASYHSDRPNPQPSSLRLTKRRGHSTFDSYIAQDKTDLLLRYEKNNIYHINRKKYTSIEREANTKETTKRPLYQHRSFFVKPQIANDYISQAELKRKHNLLRAIVRMKKNEQQPKGDSDYQQSFQRLYTGFKSIHPNPTMQRREQHTTEEELTAKKKSIPVMHTRSKSSLPHGKRLQFEQCLRWAKKHKKNGSYFAEQLGRFEKNQEDVNPVVNRSLIEDIGRKVDLSWLQ